MIIGRCLHFLMSLHGALLVGASGTAYAQVTWGMGQSTRAGQTICFSFGHADLIMKIILEVLIALGAIAAWVFLVISLLLITSVHNWPAFWNYMLGRNNHGCRATRCNYRPPGNPSELCFRSF